MRMGRKLGLGRKSGQSGGSDLFSGKEESVTPAPKTTSAANKRNEGRRETAESMAGKQKEIAVSEFFAKNRHLLGFDNPRKALLTTVKEAVDNSLDACEEGQILPEVWVKIDAINGGAKALAEAKSAKEKKAEKAQPVLIEINNPEAAETVSPSIANATRFRVTVRDN